LVARDRPETPPNGNSNPFLEALVERSQGLPLYLRLVVQDIREGKLSFKEGEEKKLPRGLASYYARVLERLQISDVAAVLTPVFCVLACAKAPLTVETLLELMKGDRLIREGGEELLGKALDFGQPHAEAGDDHGAAECDGGEALYSQFITSSGRPAEPRKGTVSYQ
jgi:hypothetical protein